MLRYLGITILFWGICVTSCQQQGQISDSERNKIESDIKQRIDELIDAAENVDIDRVAPMLTDKVDMLMGNNGYLFKSSDEMITAFRKGFKRLRGQDIKMSYSKINVLAPKIAIVCGEGNFTTTDTTGYTSPEIKYAWTFVLIKEDNSWKFAQGHQSFVPLN